MMIDCKSAKLRKYLTVIILKHCKVLLLLFIFLKYSQF